MAGTRVVVCLLALAVCAQAAPSTLRRGEYTPVATAAAPVCDQLPQYHCFQNPHGVIGNEHVASLADCCQLCTSSAHCMSWTYSNGGCRMYSDVGPTKVVAKTDPCVSGSSGPKPPPPPPSKGPNVVFLVVESTDGATWTPGYQNGVLDNNLPNIRKLQHMGVAFERHYANAPVCCPSRASFWSGRLPHHIRHMHNGIQVNGVWNNYEGLPGNYSNRIDQVLDRAGYNVMVSGKTDWSSGGHSLNVRLNSWTMSVAFPYNFSKGGWNDEGGTCGSNGTVKDGGRAPADKSAHAGDWATLNKTTAWITEKAAEDPRPFFAFQGMNIVHPPYVTNSYWFNKIDPTKIEVPEWPKLEDLHPCDLQSSNLKGCIPSAETSEHFYSVDRRRRIRRIYLAMIAEFDAMVGAYMDAVKKTGRWNNTVWIVTSDHGDMQMAHQQHYKMVPKDPSASVPMVVADARNPRTSMLEYKSPTQLVDVFPTIMDFAEVPAWLRPSVLDGHSLVPVLNDAAAAAPTLPNFVVSMFAGCNIAMPWFAVVMKTETTTQKLIQWGTGKEVEPQLFDLINDPGEKTNIYDATVAAPLEKALRSIVDYPTVALDIGNYNKESFRWWMNSTGPLWTKVIHSNFLRWTSSWNQNPEGSLEAVYAWLNDTNTTALPPCRTGAVWPPTE